MGAICPKRCTGITAAVLSVHTASRVSAVTLKVWGSTSQKTGRSPAFATAPAVAKKVKLGTITSAPG